MADRSEMMKKFYEERKKKIEASEEYLKHKQEVEKKEQEQKELEEKLQKEKEEQELEEKKQKELEAKEKYRARFIEYVNMQTLDIEPNFPEHYNKFLDDLMEKNVDEGFNHENDEDDFERRVSKIISFQLSLTELYNIHNDHGVIMMTHRENTTYDWNTSTQFVWDPQFIYNNDLFAPVLEDGANTYNLINRVYYCYQNDNEKCFGVESIPEIINKLNDGLYGKHLLSYDEFIEELTNYVTVQLRLAHYQKNTIDNFNGNNNNNNNDIINNINNYITNENDNDTDDDELFIL
jgi:hypothetical protein